MEKNKINIYCLAFVIEIILLASCFQLVNYNPLIWIAAALIGILLSINTYQIFKYIKYAFTLFVTNIQKQNEQMFNGISSFLKEGITKMQNSNQKIDHDLQIFIEKSVEYMQDADHQLKEYQNDLNVFLQEQRKEILNNLEKQADINNESIKLLQTNMTDINKHIQSQNEIFTSNIIEQNEKMFGRISDVLKEGIKKTENSNQEICNNLHSYVEKGAEYMQNTEQQIEEYHDVLNSFLKEQKEETLNSLTNQGNLYNESVKRLQKQITEIISQIQLQNNSLTNGFAESMESYSIKLDSSMKEYNRGLNETIKIYVNDMKNELITTEKENINGLEEYYSEILMQNSNKMLENYSCILNNTIEKYKRMLENQSEVFSNDIENLHEKYYNSLEETTQKNTEETGHRIQELQEFNIKANEEHNKRLDKLLTGIEVFTSNANDTNNKFNTITPLYNFWVALLQPKTFCFKEIFIFKRLCS